MDTPSFEVQKKPESKEKILWRNLRVALLIAGTIILFILGIEIIVSTLEGLGGDAIKTIIRAISNPFTAFFIGVIATAMMQSSSTTTAITVAMVASGSLETQSAVSIILGANLGTTITCTVVSLGFINNKKEFKRAVSASSYHFFFNFFTVLILFPLELFNHSLSTWALTISGYFFPLARVVPETEGVKLWSLFDPLNDLLHLFNPIISLVLGLAIIFFSILIFRKLISSLLEAKSPEAFSRFFFKNRIKSFVWGILTTAAIRSSTITTSVVVPIVAKKITPLKQATPFIMGANLGTTITAFFAASLNHPSGYVMSIAIAHFLFNLIGVIIFFPIPAIEQVLLYSARTFGKVCSENKIVILAFILLTFFFIPFLMIYLTQ